MEAEPREVGVVPHTHWDREWYAPFQATRARLIPLVDDLLDLLEHDDSYRRFLLDGQTVVVDDYAEIRPDGPERIAALVTAGRLHLGPWMVLMDELMVSGETIVRDLQLGIARGDELGGAMRVGYLPDMFGHVAQMPQILRLAGIEHAVVWRGVPAAIDRTAFWWEAPDGSRVRAEYLYGSYSNGREIPDDPQRLVDRARGYELELGDARLPGGGILLMNGSDHLPPQASLGRIVADANAAQDGYRFHITSLPEYLAEQPVDSVPTWRGELRSGARANVLMGVASNRVDVHQLCAAAERAIERRAEPLAALFLPPTDYPHALLGIAWRQLVLNSAHDSSCACSADEVVDAVTVRYQEARHLGDVVTDTALRALASDVDCTPGATLVVNPTHADRAGLVSVRVPGTGPLHFVDHSGTARPTDIVRTTSREGLSATVTGTKIRWVVELMRGPELAGVAVSRVEHTERPDGAHEFTFHEAAPGEAAVDLEPVRQELLRLGDEGATIGVRQRHAPVREAVFDPGPVAGFGWSTFRGVEGGGPATALRAERHRLANEHLTVDVDPADGTCSIQTADGVRVERAHQLVDGGDGGDTYNYSPPTDDTVVDRPRAVDVAALASGSVRAALGVTSTYLVPSHAEGDEQSCSRRSDELVELVVRTAYELRTGERFLRVHVELENRARDHRLRAQVQLPAPVEASDAECAFAVVRRGLTAEGGPHEAGLPTFVSRRFVDASDGAVGVALLHDGLLEYEVVDSGHILALTLLRATGYLSRARPALRPNPAGPLDPLCGPQLQRRLTFDYALLPHRGDWEAARLHDAADEFLVPLQTATTTRHGSRPPTGRALAVEGATVSAVLRDTHGRLTVRLNNAAAHATTARLTRDGERAAGTVVDLVGGARGHWSSEHPLAPWEIATLQLDQPR